MQRESLKQYRESLANLLRGYKDPIPSGRRYRGFLPRNLRNYMVAFLLAQNTYNPKRQYDILKRVESTNLDYALFFEYLTKVEVEKADQALVESSFRKGHSMHLEKWRRTGEVMRPIIRIIENTINEVAGLWGWKAEITYRPYRREPSSQDIAQLRKKLKRTKRFRKKLFSKHDLMLLDKLKTEQP
jgi:hypothetical protein